MRVSAGQSETNPWATWVAPILFAAFATAVFIRPYAVRAIHHGIGKTLRYIADAETYSRTVIASNYFNDGFVRRGLGGTIAVFCSRLGSQHLAVHCRIVRFAYRSAHPDHAPTSDAAPMGKTIYLGLILALSPQTFFGWSRDPSRTDLLVGACLALSVLAWLRGQRALALAVILLGLLAHETAVVYGLPLLAAMAITDLRSGALNRDEAIRLAVAGVLGIAAVIFLQMIFSAPPEVTARNMLAQAPHTRR